MAPFLSLLIPSRVRSREAVDPSTLGRRSLPEAKAPEKGVCVVAGAAAWRQRLELVDIAAAEDDVLRLERGDEATDDVLDVASPLDEPVRLESLQSDVLLERAGPVRQVAQRHRLHDPVHDHGRAETGAEPEEEHLAAAVTAERLHRGIVHDLDRTAERAPVVEADPAAPEMARLRDRAAVEDRAGKADRDRVVRPLRGGGLDSGDHQLGR